MRSLPTVVFLVASAGLVQLQGHTLGMPEVGNLSSSAILGWFAWHTAAKTMPALVKHFREELAACRAHQRTEHEAFRQELAAERTQRHADHAALREVLVEIRNRLSHS